MSDDAFGTTSHRPVVTLFEQHGAGAEAVGQKVAGALGLPFHAQAFSSEDLATADRGTAQNAVLAQVYATLGGAYGGFEGADVVATQQQRRDLVAANDEAVRRDAAGGGVIVGRNAAAILARRPSTVHVLLTGAVEDRVRRSAQAAGITLEQAASRQVREDEVRAEMSQVLYGWDPRRPEHYDLVVNTSRIPEDAVVRIVLEAVRTVQDPPSAAPF